MQISNVHVQQLLGAYLNKVEGGKSADTASASGETPADAVDLSPGARGIARAYQILASLPEVRTEKVMKLRHQIESGQYQVDSRSVADKVIESMRAARVS